MMKNLKNLNKLLLVLFIMFGSNIMAQHNHGKHGNQKNDELVAALNLTPEQTLQVNNIRSAHKKAIKDKLSAIEEPTKEQRMSIMKEEMTLANNEIIAILTPEQQEKFAQLKDEKKDKMKERRKKGK